MLTVLRDDSDRFPVTQCHFATARSCIVHLIRKFSPDVAILPSLVPEGLIRPFESEDVPIQHYRLTATLEPDVAGLIAQFTATQFWPGLSGRRPIVVVVHYFGYAMPTFEAAVLAHQHGGILLADSAHCIVNPSGRDDCADVAVYSLNKILPVTDGALMFSRSPAVDVSMSGSLRAFDERAVHAYRDHLIANRLIMAAGVRDDRFVKAAQAQSAVAYDAYYGVIDSDMEPAAPSPAAAALFGGADMVAIRAARLALAERLYDGLPAGQIWRTGLPVFAYPIRVRDRESAIGALAKAGVAASWLANRWRVAVPDPAAEAFMASHLLLPIKETMMAADVDRMIEAVRGL